MIENPGFIIEINSKRFGVDKDELENSLQFLPKEYGPKIISHQNDYGKWYYFLPETDDELMVKLFYDDGENFLLFYGNLYNEKNYRTVYEIKKNLLNVLKSNSIKKIKDYLNSFSGYFCGVIGNNYKNQIYAFTDKFGIAKLFYFIDQNKKVFSTSLFLLNKYLKGYAELSNIAASSIIYCGHIFTDHTIVKNVYQINPAHFIKFNYRSNLYEEYDYSIYPKRQNLSLQETEDLLEEAHKNFLKRISLPIYNNLTLLMSRGKDCRITLKHLLDLDYKHQIITYYRENNPIYPFVSFLTDSKDDAAIAAEICNYNKLSYQKIKIDNISFLENLSDIIILNHGGPAHWEIYEASKAASNKTFYLGSGFAGDLFAGKNKHRYTFQQIRNFRDYGKITFKNQPTDLGSYNIVSNDLNKIGMLNLISSDELQQGWIEQYKKINSNDLDILGAVGWVNTRGRGRIVPTFHQARLYTSPIYPYADNEVIEAYYTIPTKYLKGEKAHLLQLSNDERFNKFATTRLSINAKNEFKYLSFISLLRKIDYLKSKIKKSKKLSIEKSVIYNDSLRKTLMEDNNIDDKIINSILPLDGRHSTQYYNVVANLISLFRIKEVFFDKKFIKRKDISIIAYQGSLKKHTSTFQNNYSN